MNKSYVPHLPLRLSVVDLSMPVVPSKSSLRASLSSWMSPGRTSWHSKGAVPPSCSRGGGSGAEGQGRRVRGGGSGVVGQGW